MFIIKDWAGNVKWHGQKFEDFESAEEFLSEKLGDSYEEDRQEFFICDEEEEE